MGINKSILVSLGLSVVAFQLAAGQSFLSDVSKSGTSAATFLEIPVGATAIAMGGASVSMANDATSLYWNPSACALVTGNDFVASHTNWIADTRFDFGGVVIPLGGFGTLGFSLASLSMADMMVRTVEKPEGTGEYFSAGDMDVGLSYARRLTDRFAIGFTVKYVQERIWHESASAFALDVGTSFKTDLFGGMTIGAALYNFGTKMQLDGRDTRQFIRIDPTKQGSNDRIPTDIEVNSWDLPLLFQIGVSTSVVSMDGYRWTVAIDALHPSDDYESINTGTEFAYHNYLFVRAGYQSLFLDQHEGGLSFGVGVASGSLINGVAVKFDYAFRDMGRLQSVNTFSVDAQF
jgi:hypothetical protein